jgi:UDP-GlcNAc:undecaprenyl-phosphate GlcNAc-1-phosphate transferase
MIILATSVFTFVLVVAFVLAKLAPRFGLMAVPGEHRLHCTETPMVGGIAIFLGCLFAMLFGSSFSLILPSMLLMCMVGVLDDRYGLPSWSRFVAQGLAAYLMIRFTNVALVDFGYLFTSDSPVFLTDFWSNVVTIFACVGVINAINMSDGLDGLAGSMVLLVLVALFLTGHPEKALIIALMGSIVGFLFWNLRVGRSQAKVFMGDAGSMMLGLLLAYLLVQYSQYHRGIFPVTALWLLALPLVDTVAVLIVRPLRGRSPFSADRIHYHHLLLDKGLTVNQVLLAALLLQGFFIGLGVFLWIEQIAQPLQLTIFIMIFLVYTVRLYRFSGKSGVSE